jgi:hypothetical protein
LGGHVDGNDFAFDGIDILVLVQVVAQST